MIYYNVRSKPKGGLVLVNIEQESGLCRECLTEQHVILTKNGLFIEPHLDPRFADYSESRVYCDGSLLFLACLPNSELA